MNGRTHKIVGTAVGGGRALIAARGQSTPNQIVEVLGGALAGSWAGNLPDALEPALHPGHRKAAHSLAVGAAAMIADSSLRRVAVSCRDWADELRARRLNSDGVLASILLWIAEMVLRGVTGACHAIVPAYLSHLVLDVTTPRGLPVFGLA